MADKVVMVLGRPVTVSFAPAVMCNGEIVFGVFDKDALTITVAESPSRAQQRSTLLHEVLHAIISVSGGTVRGEESVVHMIECGIYEVLRNPKNKWFTKMMLEED